MTKLTQKNVHFNKRNSKGLEEKMLEKSSRVNDKEALKERGGRGGLEPTRFGDWEKNGRCIDF
ncbi:MAG: hypothetical protein A6F71_03925 [Cycloclasticus sp. symbiont of Poecilosclerida sp. M]|nr:MAG: hypothetical protein A6F71_03925 [Cycloclasticus sp. symbiont of Poecilosclerida sp. M]